MSDLQRRVDELEEALRGFAGVFDAYAELYASRNNSIEAILNRKRADYCREVGSRDQGPIVARR